MISVSTPKLRMVFRVRRIRCISSAMERPIRATARRVVQDQDRCREVVENFAPWRAHLLIQRLGCLQGAAGQGIPVRRPVSLAGYGSTRAFEVQDHGIADVSLLTLSR